MAARSIPTFLVSTEEQREILDQFQKRLVHYSEAYQKNKPLSFLARAYQKTHPDKENAGREDADATLASPMLLGICDGVSQVEDHGLDASRLPRELLKSCEEVATTQLLHNDSAVLPDAYAGPISLLKEAYSGTESLGSTSVLLAVMDNSTQIHGKLHPMVGVVTLGDCEVVMLRRTGGRHCPLQVILQTEKQRIGGHNQTPLQLMRMLEEIDPAFTEDEALDAIERGSGVHCTSTYEGDVLILGSDGVFDNLFIKEVVEIVNQKLPPSQTKGGFEPAHPSQLSDVARTIVQRAHAKSEITADTPVPISPLGVGGKADDTSVVVAEVVEWTERRRELWERTQKPKSVWGRFFSCAVGGPTCGSQDHEANSDSDSAEAHEEREDEEEDAEDEDEASGCCIA